MRFLSARELDQAIRDIASAPAPRCAVAFWGRGATKLFRTGERARLICNLRAGGTNPHEIEALLKDGHEVRQNDALHAKVYIGGGRAVVGSANLSANGLGLEAAEVGHWIEAGVVIRDLGEVSAWFEAVWRKPETRGITKADARSAKRLWENRRSCKPSLTSFRHFDVESDRLPLVVWHAPGETRVNFKSVEEQIGLKGEAAQRAVEDSIEVQGPAEEPLLREGTWLLWWKLNADGTPSRRSPPTWLRCGRLVRSAARYGKERKWRDVVLNEPGLAPEPFACDDERFVRVFREVISLPQFQALREEDYEPPFIPSRIGVMKRFWRELHNAYSSAERQRFGRDRAITAPAR